MTCIVTLCAVEALRAAVFRLLKVRLWVGSVSSGARPAGVRLASNLDRPPKISGDRFGERTRLSGRHRVVSVITQFDGPLIEFGDGEQ